MARRKASYIFAPDKPERRGGMGCLLAVLIIAAALAAAVFTMNYAMNQRVELKEEKVSVMNLDKAFEGFTLLHISDLQASAVGSDSELWRELLFSKSFHAVVLSGDMVGLTGDFEPLLDLIRILQEIKKDVPIYLIAGDEDPNPVVGAQGSTEALAGWVRAAQKQGAIYLDAPMAVEAGKRKVWITPEYLYDVDAESMVSSLTQQKLDMESAGQPYDGENGAVYRALCYRLDAMERTVAALAEMDKTDLQVAVNHAPLEASYIRTSLEWADQTQTFNFRNISLLLCGHYCGGQWRVPGSGPVYVPERGWFSGDNGVTGMQRVNSINQYISPGIGDCDEYPMKGRLFNPPAVTLLKFTSSLQGFALYPHPAAFGRWGTEL